MLRLVLFVNSDALPNLTILNECIYLHASANRSCLCRHVVHYFNRLDHQTTVSILFVNWKETLCLVCSYHTIFE